MSNTCKGGGLEMSRVRVCVEWGFGKIAALWAGVDYDRYAVTKQQASLHTFVTHVLNRRQQLFLTSPGSHYLTAGLLTNLHTCM